MGCRGHVHGKHPVLSLVQDPWIGTCTHQTLRIFWKRRPRFRRPGGPWLTVPRSSGTMQGVDSGHTFSPGSPQYVPRPGLYMGHIWACRAQLLQASLSWKWPEEPKGSRWARIIGVPVELASVSRSCKRNSFISLGLSLRSICRAGTYPGVHRVLGGGGNL